MRLRRETVAYIFQSFGLLPVLSAAENVGVPLRISGVAPRQREERVALLLSVVGLSDHARQRPGELSGGQQQRVAIARALATRPALLLADEPTGQLDQETGKQIMRLLRAVVRSEGVTALVATHDPALIDIADSVLQLEDGKIADGLDHDGAGGGGEVGVELCEVLGDRAGHAVADHPAVHGHDRREAAHRAGDEDLGGVVELRERVVADLGPPSPRQRPATAPSRG